MELLSFVIAYFAATAALAFVLLFGEAPLFARTPVPQLHWLLTQGWVSGVEWAVGRLLGQRGVHLLDAVATCCCERSNPALQAVYLGTVGLCYWLYTRHVFSLMPSQDAPLYHIYTGTSAVCLAVGSFLAASTSDPGRVTPANAALLLRAYPPDGVLYRPKSCATCGFARPARSRHCSACGCCVARLDHHCQWINACVGLRNTRHFLTFLAANLALCAYAAALAARAVWGDMRRRGLLAAYTFRGLGTTPVMLRLLEYVAVYYGVAAAVCMFAAVCALLLAGFLAHQLWLIGCGTTTVEVSRLRELAERRRRREVRRRKRSGLQGSGGGEGSDDSREGTGGDSSGEEVGATGGARRVAPRRGQPAQPPYHRGSVWRNFREVLLPDTFLAEQAAAGEGRPVLGGGARERQGDRRGARRGGDVRRRTAAEQEAGV